MKTAFLLTIFAACALLGIGRAAAATNEFTSAEAKVSVLELFTSEGCSSCPPAERWVSALKENPRLWKDLVVLSFHVDYWDDLGWKDPFALREFTDRQRTYAAQWRTASVYTPGFVLDGKEWTAGSNRPELPPGNRMKVGVLSAKSTSTNAWNLTFRPSEGMAPGALKLSGALLGFDVTSRVKAGENSGRTLEHDFVVLDLRTQPARRVGETFQTSLTLSTNLTSRAKRLGVAFWVTDGNRIQPIQAVGGWIIQ